MDKKLLSAFSNLSVALQELSDSLSEINKSKETSGSSIVDALKSLDITTQLKSIDEGVKKIQVDNKEILSNQKKMMESMSKTKQASPGKIGELGDPSQKQRIKDGVGMILLIAGGVLAIGLAFKLVGGVDFKSVIALGIVLPLLAIAFEKVSKIKTTLKDIALSSIGLVMMSVSVAAASRILQYVKPIGALQLLTTILIGAAFAILAISIDKLANGVKGVDAKNLWKLPLVLLAASVAIALSSQVLQYVKPVGFLQLLTTIMIAGAFTVLSFGIGKLAQAMGKIDLKGVALLPLVLVGVSVAIMYSSGYLSKVVPITFAQAVSTIFIAATFVILSYGLPKLAESVSKVGIAKAALMPIVLIAMSAAILGSSYILSQVQVIPLGTLINIALQAISLTVMGVALGFTIALMDKMGLDPVKVFEGSLSLVIIAGALMASSLLLSLGSYENYPGLGWTIGTAASMLVFGIATVAIGLAIMASGGLGLGGLVLGALGTILIAGTIVETASILGTGAYAVYPDLGWASGVGLSLVAFGLSMGAIGLYIAGTLGLGYIGMMAGAEGVKLVANTIVETASILSTGNFSGGPSLAWATGTGLLVTAFGAATLALGVFIGGTLGLGYLALKAGSSAISLVAQSIVDTSYILSGGKFTGGPTKEWAEGVGLAIGAFAPVFAVLSSRGIIDSILGSKVTPGDMSNAIQTIALGIINAGDIFGKNKASFDGTYPSEDWSRGVGDAISAFSPIFEFVNKNSSWFGAGTDFLTNSITEVAKSISSSANILAGGDYTNIIPNGYISGISDNIIAYMKLIDRLRGYDSDDISMMGIITLGSSSGISKMADDYAKLATSIGKLSSSIQTIDIEKITALKTLTGSIVLMSLMDSDQFKSMMDALENKAKIFVDVIKDVEGSVSSTELSIKASSNKESGPSISDVLNVMNRMDSRLGQIVATNNNISGYVNEIRSGGRATIRKK